MVGASLFLRILVWTYLLGVLTLNEFLCESDIVAKSVSLNVNRTWERVAYAH